MRLQHVRFVIATSVEEMLKDFSHFYHPNNSPVESLQEIEKMKQEGEDVTKIRIVKITFEELP